MFRYAGIFCIALYILGWIAYLEISPSMGNVWWRQGPEGTKEFCPWGIWATAVAPFKRGHGIFWWPTFWDINPWPVLGIMIGVAVYWWFNENACLVSENSYIV